MKPHAELEKVNTDKVVDALLHVWSKPDFKAMVEAATAASGHTVSATGFDPTGGLSPTFHFPLPLPAKFNDFVGFIIASGGYIKLFPYGIIIREGLLVQVGRQAQ